MDTSTEDEMFALMLQSMGVTHWDPLVTAALADYSRRYVSEVLSDSKDYSNHCNRNEIEPEDVQFATRMSNNTLNQLDKRTQALKELAAEVNSKVLTEFFPKEDNPRMQRYAGNLLARRYTYVPMTEAYSAESLNDTILINSNNSAIESGPILLGHRSSVQPLVDDKFPRMQIAPKPTRKIDTSFQMDIVEPNQ